MGGGFLGGLLPSEGVTPEGSSQRWSSPPPRIPSASRGPSDPPQPPPTPRPSTFPPSGPPKPLQPLPSYLPSSPQTPPGPPRLPPTPRTTLIPSISPHRSPSPGHRPRKTPASPAHLGLAPARQPFHHSPRLWLRQPQRRLIPESPQKRPLLPRRPRRSGWGNRRRPPRGHPEPRRGRTGPQRRLHLGKGAAQRDDVMRRNGREKMTARATSGRSWGPWLTSLQRDYRFVLQRLLFTSLLPGCTMGNAVPSHGSCLRIPPHDPPPPKDPRYPLQ